MEIIPIYTGNIKPKEESTLPFERKPLKVPTKQSTLRSASDDYDLDIRVEVINTMNPHQQTGSVTCPPCNETNNSCYGTQCCSGTCSGNANCS